VRGAWQRALHPGQGACRTEGEGGRSAQYALRKYVIVNPCFIRRHARPHADTQAATLAHVRRHFGLAYFEQRRFDPALNHFLAGRIDPLFVLALFPSFLAPEQAACVKSKCLPLGGNSVTLECPLSSSWGVAGVVL